LVPVVAIVGALMSVAVFGLAQKLDMARVRGTLELRAEWRARDFEHKLDIASESVEALADYVAVQTTLDRDALRRFSHLAHADQGSGQALIWAPLVTGADRAGFEAEARRDWSADYAIMQRDETGRITPAAARDAYLPTLFEEPFNGQKGPPGLDHLSLPDRRPQVERARDEGRPIATPPLTIYLDGGEATGFLIYWPVYSTGQVPATVDERRARFRGMAAGRFLFDQTVQAAIAGTPRIIESIDFLVDRGSDGSPPAVVASFDPGSQSLSVGKASDADASAAITLTREFDNLGRHWTIRSYFSPGMVAGLRSEGPWSWLSMGLILTALATIYAHRERARRFGAEALARTRTVQLLQTNATLAQESADRRQTEAYFRATFEQSAFGMALIALDGTWLQFNDRFCEIIGFKRAEMDRLTALDITHPDDRANYFELTRRFVSGEASSWSRDKHYIRSDGQSIWARINNSVVRDEAGRALFFVAIMEDISSVKTAEESVRVSEERLRSALRGSAVGVAEQDLDLRYTYLDVQFANHTLGGEPLRPELFVGKTDYEIYGPGHDAIPQKLAVIATGRPLIRELVLPVDGTQLVFEMRTEARRDHAGRVIGLLSSFIDVTGRRGIEAQLRQSLKMEAIGNLTGGMAHDFNNLLAVIIGNIEEMRLVGRLDPATDEFAGQALTAALRGADLTRRLLAFARQQALEPERIELNALIAEITKLMRRTLGENVEISLELAGDTWPVMVDPAQLEAAIINLAANARDAMPKGGRLTIATANRRLDEDYATRATELAAGDYVMIEVSDTGTGIPPDVMRRIFEPFFTTKERGRGTGLGLAMVFGFIKQSGGHIAVYSEPGAGTTFRIYLPRATGETEAALPAPAAAIARGSGETILVVEDNADLRRLVVRQLRTLGYRVLEAPDAAAALELLEREPVDMVFTDVVMPGGTDGAQLARRVIESWPGIKVVLTSGFPESRLNGDLGPLLPALRLLVKPYQRRELARVLYDVLHS
jgi:PAS domain S-box-containing protein